MKTDKAEEVLRKLEKTRDSYWNVPRETGEFLNLLARIKSAKSILEIGTSNGYSGIFLALAVKDSKGRLTTIEGDWNRAAEARKNFIDAGVMRYAEIVIGDARDVTRKLSGSFDFVFIDANKEQYLLYLKNIEKNLKKGAVVVADNILSHKERLKDYVDHVRNSKKYDSILLEIGTGEMISVRK